MKKIKKAKDRWPVVGGRFSTGSGSDRVNAGKNPVATARGTVPATGHRPPTTDLLPFDFLSKEANAHRNESRCD